MIQEHLAVFVCWEGGIRCCQQRYFGWDPEFNIPLHWQSQWGVMLQWTRSKWHEHLIELPSSTGNWAQSFCPSVVDVCLCVCVSAVLIDDIQHGAEVANTKVRSQTRRIAEVRRKDSCRCTCCECIYHLYIGTSDKCSSEIDLSTKDIYLFQPHANTYKCIIWPSRWGWPLYINRLPHSVPCSEVPL